MEMSSLPPLALALIEAAVPPRLQDAVIGDFEEQLVARRGRSKSAAAVWLWREVLACLSHWLHYWLTSACSVRVAAAVVVGLAATGLGLVVVDLGPLPEILAEYPPAWRLPIWLLEGGLVVATTFVRAKIGRAEARQAGWGLGAVLALVPFGRYCLGDDVVGVSWLILEDTMVVTCVALGGALAARPADGPSTAPTP